MKPFLGIDDPRCDPDVARVLIIPVPYEGTVTYGKGTAGGPEAVLAASEQVELYDEYLACEPWRAGIAALPPLEVSPSPDAMVQRVEKEISPRLQAGRLIVTLGGEHSVSIGAVSAHLGMWPDLAVVQFDAHADLRETYQGSAWNHACTMARIRSAVPSSRVLQLGLRSMSAEEAAIIRDGGYAVHHARDILRDSSETLRAISQIPDTVYITFDVDVFDPAVVRSTGTPEPGGLTWYATMEILECIFRSKRVVGFDVVELSEGDTPSAFAVARLIYRMAGLWLQG